MEPSHIYKTEAVILKRKNVGEGDRIITLFTKDYGKMHVIAKGVRRITSRRAAHLEVFCRVFLLLHRGKVWDAISEVHAINPYVRLRRELSRVSVGYYFCELIDRLLAEKQEHRDVFALLISSLETLNIDQVGDLDELEQRFSRELLIRLGFLAKGGDLAPGDIPAYIERIIERRLNSRRFLTKLRQ